MVDLRGLVLYSSISQRITWRGILVSGIRNTCNNHLSHHSVLISSNFFNRVTCPLPNSFILDCLSSDDADEPSLKLVTSRLKFFFLCTTDSRHSSALYSIVDRTSDSYSFTFIARPMFLLFEILCNRPKTRNALPILSGQSLSQFPACEMQLSML